MKTRLILLLFIFVNRASAQTNAFATTQFAQAFTKLYGEAPKGFPSYRDAKKTGELGNLAEQYRIKTLLPGMDSGEIFIPFIGSCNARFSIKPAKTKEEAETRRNQLMTAIEKIVGKTLYVKEKANTLKQFTYFNKDFYVSPITSINEYDPEFATYIVQDKGLYKISLSIKGDCYVAKPVEKKPALNELDAEGKLAAIYSDAPNYFSSIRDVQLTTSNQYYTHYDTKLTLFGMKGKIEDGKYDAKLSYSFAFTLFNSLPEAESLYQQLKMALQKSLAGKINFGAEQQSKYDALSYSIQGLESGKSFLQSKLKINLIIKRDEKYPAVYLHADRMK